MEVSMRERTSLTIEHGIARIVMDDGKVNAMSVEMLDEVAARLEAAATAATVVVLEGRPGIFSAGFDLATFGRGPVDTERMVAAGVGLIERLLTYPLPVVTACTGHAYPMGAFLMLAADARLGLAGDFRIGMNEVAIGLTVPQFAVTLARHRLAPAGLARVASAAMLDPEAAVGAGFLDQVVAPERFAAAVAAAAERLSQLDPASYRATKTRINGPLLAELSAAWAQHKLN
jgi:enoyl-CoA hydratase